MNGNGKENKSKLLTWVGILTSLITVSLTGWNYQLSNKVSQDVYKLNEAKFEVDRLKFVSDLLTDISKKKK